MSSPPIHAADRLIAAIDARRAPVCVGIDPVIDKLPASLTRKNHSELPATSHIAQAVSEFVQGILEAVSPHVPSVKFQSACFERYGHELVRVRDELIAEARTLGLEVILDAKRGDIGLTAEHYAVAAFGASENPGASHSDWITINAYLGRDGIEPFLKTGHGAFALVRTSNPGGDAIQNLRLTDGRTVAQAVAQIVADIGRAHVGQRGYSGLGAVVGATKSDDARTLRELMPQQIFLVPGYGAQGGGIDDVMPCFKSDGGGAIITASRSVIYAFEPNDPKWTEAIGEAAAEFADQIGRAVGMR